MSNIRISRHLDVGEMVTVAEAERSERQGARSRRARPSVSRFSVGRFFAPYPGISRQRALLRRQSFIIRY